MNHKQLRKEIGKIEKLKTRKKFQCLFPRCSNFSIDSHSQQRGGQLKIISKNDEVFSMNFSMYDVLTKGSSAFSLVKTRIKNASTYPGFCQIHDGQVFSPIEKQPLKKGDELQAATFFLRAVTYEVTRKKLVHFGTQKILENCEGMLSEVALNNFKQQNLGREKFIKLDLPFYLENAYKAYDSPDLGILKTKWIVIPKKIKASSCTVFSPLLDFQERVYHQAIASPQILSSFNLVPLQDETHVIVSWLAQHAEENEWIESAMDAQLEKFINYVAICESEDICIGPELWESVDIFTRERVYEAMHHEIYRGALDEIPCIIRI
ncbi:TPA: hypothetical protein ACGUON_000773 [Vibrio vulnificus]|uniref:hypothetical protein n=2 Tax=Vibrio TaxID=662 RepID=UPI000BA98E8D|nr:hypothetical protein [Vibrio metoecus]EJL6615656.1 hypothetical protein [Vibrio cholerae]EKF9281227.1 hypothetical protein [Vibrio cholerae]PAR33875.1 hypothetical protein CGT97_18920 [Vibrio metoecus]PAR38793.1 hypothetical protein CGT96_18925 [Vibrio metoecus]